MSDPEPPAGEATTDGSGPSDAGASPSTNGHADAGDREGKAESIGIVEARSLALGAVEDLLEHELEGVVRVEAADDGWRTLVEVVERSAVPDTQDIIGRYEVLLDDTGTVTGYGLVERYRRGDMKEEL